MNLRKVLFTIFAFNLFNSIALCEIKTSSQLRSTISKTNKRNLISKLRSFIASSKPNRFISTTGHTGARKYLKKELSSIDTYKVESFKSNLEVGQNVYENNFNSKVKGKYKTDSNEYKKWKAFTEYMKSEVNRYQHFIGKNYEVILKGTSDKKIYVVGHYDHAAYDKVSLKILKDVKMEGADYNASSTAIMLEMINNFKTEQLVHSVHFVFLDYQSVGFQGSYVHAESLKGDKNILGVLNLEMLGHDSKAKDLAKKHYNYKAYMRSTVDDDLKFYTRITKMSKKARSRLKFVPLRNDFSDSDGFRYWDAGLPALTFTQDWESDLNPNYQTSNDFVETINQKSYYAAYKFIAFTVFSSALELKK